MPLDMRGTRHGARSLLFTWIFLYSAAVCAAQPQAQDKTPAPAPGPRMALVSGEARPGEPVTVVYATGESAGAAGFRAVLSGPDGRRLSQALFFDYTRHGGENIIAAFLPVPSTAGSGSALIHIEKDSEPLAGLDFVILERDFVSEEINLDPHNTDIRTEPDPQKTKESETLWSILSRTGGEIYAEGLFVPPVTSTRRTSFFGDRRVYVYSSGGRDTAVHAGIDYGVPTGTPVLACAPGKVVLAAPRITTGNSVVVEHLPGVYSIYYHLNTIGVKEGMLINAGTLLGESGSTGLSTGPHLHWEIRVSGENTDPDFLTSRLLLDKNAIISIITP